MKYQFTQKKRGPVPLTMTCPDYDCRRQVCAAATGMMVPGRRQQMRYCATCDYDSCPIYLCKALRSSRSQGLDHESILDSGK